MSASHGVPRKKPEQSSPRSRWRIELEAGISVGVICRVVEGDKVAMDVQITKSYPARTDGDNQQRPNKQLKVVTTVLVPDKHAKLIHQSDLNGQRTCVLLGVEVSDAAPSAAGAAAVIPSTRPPQTAAPSAKRSQRSEIKKVLHQLYSNNKKVRGNIFRAMHQVKVDYLPKS